MPTIARHLAVTCILLAALSAYAGSAAEVTPVCPAAPSAECRVPNKSLLLLKDSTNDAADKLLWKWSGGDDTGLSDLGDPVSGTTDYALCVYSTSGGTPELVMSPVSPGGSVCAGSSCWRYIGARGFRYRDKQGSADGVTKILLKTGSDQQARMLIKGRGANLPMPTSADVDNLLAQDPTVTVQLTNSERQCWEATYEAPALRATGDRFRDAVTFHLLPTPTPTPIPPTPTPGVPTPTPTALPFCGDGKVGPGEQCDPPDDAFCPGLCGAPGGPEPCECIGSLSCQQIAQPPGSCTTSADCPPIYACVDGACRAGPCVVKADCAAEGQCVHQGSAPEGTCICRGCNAWDCPLGCTVGGFFSGCLCETEFDCPPEDDVCFLGVCS